MLDLSPGWPLDAGPEAEEANQYDLHPAHSSGFKPEANSEESIRSVRTVLL